MNVESAKNAFAAYLNEVDLPDSPTNLYMPVRYMLTIGGKRMRPALLIIANDMLGGELQKALPAAAAIEWFHNFTLVHDDIMDKATLRRGNETVEKKYSLNTAILSGDVMLLQAYDFLLKLPATIQPTVLKVFNKVATLVCEGQQLDMDFETQNIVSTEAYLDMIGKKTAALLAGSLKIGALIAEADEDTAQRLYDFGYHLGISFQLMDDYLDAFGNPDEVGKIRGGDIILNKKTYLLIMALEKAQGEDSKILNALLNSTEENKVTEVLSIFKKLKIDKLTKEKIMEYHTSATALLNEIDVEPLKKAELIRFAGILFERTN